MAELIDTAEVIVCCGSGGVGKTTVADLTARLEQLTVGAAAAPMAPKGEA